MIGMTRSTSCIFFRSLGLWAERSQSSGQGSVAQEEWLRQQQCELREQRGGPKEDSSIKIESGLGKP